jgi:hypothetical protein
MASSALRRIISQAKNSGLRRLTEKTHMRATGHSGVRTASNLLSVAAASAASGYRPDIVTMKGKWDIRLGVGVGVAVYGAYREAKGKRSTMTSALEGAGDGVLASYVGEKALAYGQRMRAEADASSSSDSAANAAAAAAQAQADKAKADAAANAPKLDANGNPIKGLGRSTGADAVRRITITDEPEFAGDRYRGRGRLREAELIEL